MSKKLHNLKLKLIDFKELKITIMLSHLKKFKLMNKRLKENMLSNLEKLSNNKKGSMRDLKENKKGKKEKRFTKSKLKSKRRSEN